MENGKINAKNFLWTAIFTLVLSNQFAQSPAQFLMRFNRTKDTTGLYHQLTKLELNYAIYSPQQMIPILQQTAKWAEVTNYKQLHTIYFTLKKCYDLSDNKSKSFEYALKLYALLRETNNEKVLLWVLIDLGNIFFEEKDFDQALLFYHQAERIGKREKQFHPLAVIYLNYGLIESRKENHSKALSFFKTSCYYRTKSENIKLIADTYIKIASEYRKMGKNDSCYFYIQKAEDYFSNFGQKTATLIELPININTEYAYYFYVIKQPEKAYEYLQKSTDYALEKGLFSVYISTQLIRAEFKNKAHKTQEAIQLLEQLNRQIRRANKPNLSKEIYRKLGFYFSELNDFQKANYYFDAFIKLEQSEESEDFRAKLNLIRSISYVYENDSKLQKVKNYLAIAKLNSKLNAKDKSSSIYIIVFSISISLILSALFINLRTNRRKLVRLHTQLEVQNTEMKRNSIELERSNYLKDKLFSIIAHDLRNPLNRMLVELAILKNKVANEKLTHGMEVTLKETIELFEGLLQWSKLDNKQNIYSPSKINLKEFINRILALYETDLQSKEIEVHKELAPLYAFVDQTILLTLIRNLISNGIYFVSKSEQKRSIEVKIEEIGNSKIRIYISNSGAPFQPAILADFYNSDEYVLSKSSGLGLSISKLLAHMFQWEIQIGNKPNSEGVFLTIDLPKFNSQEDFSSVKNINLELSESAKKELLVFQQYKFYQTSQLRALIKTLKTGKDMQTNQWLTLVELAITEGDESAFKKWIEFLNV